LRKLFRKSRISPGLRSLKKRIAAKLNHQHHAINYFYNRLDGGHYGELNHLTMNRALIYALISWILDYKSEGKGLGLPFEQPYVTFYKRCHTIGTIVKKLLNNKYVEHESIRDDLLKIYHIVDIIHVDKRFKTQINKIVEKLTLFNELRDTLRLFDDEKQGINGCLSFHSKQELNSFHVSRLTFHEEEKLMFKNYLKITLRNILKYKGYSVINILGLAIGMAACLLILIYVQDELSYDNFHKDGDRIFRIVLNVQSQAGQIEYATTPSSLAQALKNDYPQVEHITRLMNNPELMIRYEDKKFNENRIYHTDPEIFEVFNIQFLQGDARSCLNRPRTVVITESIAKKYVDNENPLGKLLDFGYAKCEITGVIKEFSHNSHLKFDFLLSLKPFNNENWMTAGWENFDGQTNLTYTYIKLKPGTDIKFFKNQIKHLSERYAGGVQLKESGTQQSYFLQPIRSIHLHSNRRNEAEAPGSATDIAIFSAIAFLILLIACLNFINLTTARSVTRAKEVGMRKILGAFRLKLIKQFLGESLVLTIISLLIALVIIELSLPWFNGLVNKELNFDPFANVNNILYLIGIVLCVGLIAGSYPAFFLASFRPAKILRGGSNDSMQEHSIRKVLVIFQFAASIMLIVGTLIVYQQLRFMKKSDLGFDKDRLLVLPVPVGSLFDKNSEEFISKEFMKHHSVISATTTSFIPGMTKNLFKGSFKQIGEGDAKNYDMNIMMVDHDFINTYKIELTAGRAFEKDRSTDSENACLINEPAAKIFGWTSAEEAVGKRIEDFQEREIIGIIKNFHFQSLQHIIEPLVLMINPDFFIYMTLRIDHQNLPETMAFVEQKWNELFPNEPFTYHFFDDIFDIQYRADEKFGTIILIFAGLAIFIACLGLFGLTLFTTERRTREIGIRKVLGSSISKIIFLLSKDLMKWVFIANIIALPIGWYVMSRWLQNFAYRITVGWWIFILSGMVALVIALISVSFQSVKAAVANPVESLRYE
jgi:putative ABC transport system permease protein